MVNDIKPIRTIQEILEAIPRETNGEVRDEIVELMKSYMVLGHAQSRDAKVNELTQVNALKLALSFSADWYVTKRINQPKDQTNILPFNHEQTRIQTPYSQSQIYRSGKIRSAQTE